MKLAVLPMENQTNNLTGPELVREMLHFRIGIKGYNVLPLEEVDSKLQEIGITDGGQLSAVSVGDLAAAIDADVFLYGKLIEFKYFTLGFYYKRTVKAYFKLVDARTGRLIWEETKREANSEFTLDPDEIKEQLIFHFTAKLLENIFKSPLKPEVEVMLRRVMRQMPFERRLRR